MYNAMLPRLWFGAVRVRKSKTKGITFCGTKYDRGIFFATLSMKYIYLAHVILIVKIS